MRRKRSQAATLKPGSVIFLIVIVVGLFYYLGVYRRQTITQQLLKQSDITLSSNAESSRSKLSKASVLSSRHQLRKDWRTVHQQLESVASQSVGLSAEQSRVAAVWRLSWQSCMHGWRYRLWTEGDNDRLIHQFAPWFQTTYERLTNQHERLVVARYLYMYVHGGVYADADSRCLRSFEHLLNDCGVALSAAGKTDGSIATSFMFSKPGHQLWLRLLKLVHDIVWQRQPAPPGVTSVADPLLLANIMEQTLHSFKDGGSSGRVCVMPAVYFAPPVNYEANGSLSNGCRPWLQMTSKDLTRCESANIRSYVLHLPTVPEK